MGARKDKASEWVVFVLSSLQCLDGSVSNGLRVRVTIDLCSALSRLISKALRYGTC